MVLTNTDRVSMKTSPSHRHMAGGLRSRTNTPCAKVRLGVRRTFLIARNRSGGAADLQGRRVIHRSRSIGKPPHSEFANRLSYD